MRLAVLLLTSDCEVKFCALRSLLDRQHPGRGHLLRTNRVHLARVELAERRAATTLFHDEMWHVATDLCFGSLVPLLDGRVTRYQVMATGDVVDLSPVGDRVTLSGRKFAPLSVPRDPLVELLYRRGCDYVDLLASLGPPYEPSQLQRLADEASRVLDGRGLSTVRPPPRPDD